MGNRASAWVDRARGRRVQAGARLGMVAGMRSLSARVVVAGCLVAASCGGSQGETEASFGPGVGTAEETTQAMLTTTATPTTTTPTTSEDPSTGASEASASSSSGAPEPSTGTGAETSTGAVEETSATTTTGEEMTTGEVCEAPGILLVCDDQDDDPFHALGLGCEGALENTIPIAKTVFKSNKYGFAVARGYGTAEDPDDPGKLLFRPREGEKFLIISTGEIGALDGDGVLVETQPQYENDNNFNPDMPNALPAPMSALVGSNMGKGGTPSQDCDGINDCSDSIDPNWKLGNSDPNDVMWASFEVAVPAGTHGFSFDVAYFSSEYPEFVGKKFNDMFIGWATSEVYTGNVTFLNGQPFTVTALATEMESAGFTGDAPELLGTGFEAHGSTGWATVNAQASPGEALVFAFAIMDMGDSSKATLAILDHWRWSCVGCVPIEADPLCGKPGHPKCCGLCVEKDDDPKCDTMGHPACCVPE